MTYTILELSRMAGITPRALRFYDQKGLLCPRRHDSSGYRLYESDDLDRLQQILFYRELGVQLSDIGRILDNASFDHFTALKEHREQLIERRAKLNRLIDNVDKTLAAHEGGKTMPDNEKFEGFKEQMIEENEQKHGAEVREKYGNKAVDESNRKLMDLKEEEYDTMQRLAGEVLDTLKAALKAGDPASELAQRCAELHRQWLTFSWPSYSGDAHAGLAQMYVDDARFRAYYDGPAGDGAAEFLRDAVFIYTGKRRP